MGLTEFLLARIAEDERELVADPPVGLGYANLERRMLAECEAKRRIASHHVAEGHYVYDDESPACACCGDYTIKWPCQTLRYLARPYADHVDYDESWRP